MTERADERAPTTADIAAAANAAARPAADRAVTDREVEFAHGETRADRYEMAAMRLLPDDVVDDLRPRWADIQASFVDAPRRAVEEADKLVADAIRRLADAFAEARSDLEREWDRGEEGATGDLRLAVRR